MSFQNRNHLSLTLAELEKEGYTDQLKFEKDSLINLTNGRAYQSDKIAEIKEFRFEGMSSPNDMSILFAITLHDGRKGTLAAAYGPEGDADLFSYLSEAEAKR